MPALEYDAPSAGTLSRHFDTEEHANIQSGTLHEITKVASRVLSSRQFPSETIPLSPVASQERSFNTFPALESNQVATTTPTPNRFAPFLQIIKNITLYIGACILISATLAAFFIAIFYIYIGPDHPEVFRAWLPFCFGLCGGWVLVFNMGLIIKKSIGDERSFYQITYEVFHDVERCMVACGIIMLTLVLTMDVMYRTRGRDEKAWWTVREDNASDVNEILRKLRLEGYE